MKTRKRFCLFACITLLLVMLLPHHTSTSAPSASVSGLTPFTEHTITESGRQKAYAIDMDGDGDMDVLSPISWWENDGSENFVEHIIDPEGAYAVYAADLDGDGDVDVLSARGGAAFDTDDITWWENDGNQSFTGHVIRDNFDLAISVHASDVDGDGDMDVLGAARAADDITWWENDGSESFTEHTIDGFFDGAHSVYASDVDGDGDVDVLGAAWLAYDITWWENDGTQSFTEHTIDSDFLGAQVVYATDVDGDGDVDVLGAAYSGDEITWWENDGSESFTEHTIDGDLNGPRCVYASDVDGDGDVDVLGVASYADDITWWENDGSENFTKHTIDGQFDSARWVDAADVDGDGDVDVLGATPTDGIAWWEQRSPGSAVFLPAALNNAGPPASAPVLDDIANPDGNGDYTVSWSAVERAINYTLQEDDNPGFSSPTTRYFGSDTSRTITGKSVGTYYYRVMASNDLGSSDWSEVKSVEVTIEPTAEPPPSCPDAGAWSGSTNQGSPIDFSVSSSCRAGDLTIEYWVVCPAGIMWKKKTFDYSTSITDDRFEFDDDGDPTVSGRFTSQTRASGTWSSSFSLPGVGTCSGSGTWSANGP